MDAWLHRIYFESMSVYLNSPNFVILFIDLMLFRNTICYVDLRFIWNKEHPEKKNK